MLLKSSASNIVPLWTESRRSHMDRRILIMCFMLWLLGSTHTLAAFRAFLQIPDVPGESTDPKHQDWIELSGIGSSALPGSVSSVIDFGMVKGVDRSTPALNLACAAGQSFSEMRIELEVPDRRQARLYRLELKGVVITSMITQFDPAATPYQLVNRISLSCTSMSWSYVSTLHLPLIYRSSLWELLRGGKARGIPALRASGSLNAGGIAEIRWTGRTGHSYRILAGSQVEGPYAPIAVVKAASNGAQRVSHPVIPGMRFFMIEESPQSQ